MAFGAQPLPWSTLWVWASRFCTVGWAWLADVHLRAGGATGPGRAACHCLPPALLRTTHVLCLLVHGTSQGLAVQATTSLRSGEAVWVGYGIWLPVSWPGGPVNMLAINLREELGMEIVCSEAQAALQQCLSCKRTTWGLLLLRTT